MVKIKVSDADGHILDWLVAKADGVLEPLFDEPRPRIVLIKYGDGYRTAWNPHDFGHHGAELYDPSVNWGYGGPFIDREQLSLCPAYNAPDTWLCCANDLELYGPTALVAAMRCFVTKRLGHEVDIPEELLS